MHVHDESQAWFVGWIICSVLSVKLPVFGKRGYMNDKWTSLVARGVWVIFDTFCIQPKLKTIGVPLDIYQIY